MASKLTPEQSKLRRFLKDNFCFSTLKKVGFYKDINATEYDKQAARICQFFGFESVYEYDSPQMQDHADEAVTSVSWPAMENSNAITYKS